MGVTCLVSIHGIGFQQPPRDGRMGYADPLHTNLHKADLGHLVLGDDPHRRDVRGPVYVQSSWHEVREAGLKRLDGPLFRDDQAQVNLAHVALVYADLVDPGPRLASTLDALAQTALSFDHYAHPLAAIRTIIADLAAMVTTHGQRGGDEHPSLRPREDLPDDKHAHLHLFHDILRAHRPRSVQSTEGPLAVLRALEDDVADYVCRNDLRERIRGFVQQALHRLADRADVDAIVVNAHSQGTVVAFDVLARSAPPKVRALVTAGSPLRKYVDFFAWGERAGLFRELMQRDRWCWLNAYDPRDPVADPLRPSRRWHLGDDPSDQPTLFRIIDPNKSLTETDDCAVIDYKVDNVAHSVGSGLRAHNYWDNTADFIPRLITVLSDLVRSRHHPAHR